MRHAVEAPAADEIAAIISQASGKTVPVVHATPDDVIGRGYMPGLVLSEEWLNVEGYKVDPTDTVPYGIKLTTFADFAEKRAADFVIGDK